MNMKMKTKVKKRKKKKRKRKMKRIQRARIEVLLGRKRVMGKTRKVEGTERRAMNLKHGGSEIRALVNGGRRRKQSKMIYNTGALQQKTFPMRKHQEEEEEKRKRKKRRKASETKKMKQKKQKRARKSRGKRCWKGNM